MEAAIQKDCETIIESFIWNKNPRFESFVQQWKSLSFHGIYTAQSFSTEIIQSTDACLHYGKRVLAHKTTLFQLGALFLLYAIYFKQPTERHQKIDIDLATWIKLKEFLKSLDERNGLDARCIFLELLKEDAFRFVASDIYHGLENFLDLDKIQLINLNKTMHVFRNEVNQLTCRQGLFSGIAKLEEGYNEMKEMMNQSTAEDKPLALLPISNSFLELKSAISSLQSFIRKNCAHWAKKDKDVNEKKDRVKKKVIKKSNYRTGGRIVLR